MFWNFSFKVFDVANLLILSIRSHSTKKPHSNSIPFLYFLLFFNIFVQFYAWLSTHTSIIWTKVFLSPFLNTLSINLLLSLYPVFNCLIVNNNSIKFHTFQPNLYDYILYHSQQGSLIFYPSHFSVYIFILSSMFTPPSSHRLL